jgi:hypothetical protein
VRHDFGKFGEVVSVRGALGKQKGHVFVRFRRKEAAENCLNCLNSFPLSEMSELFGKYLYLSPATPRDIDCDMYGLYSISFLNLNMKSFREIRAEFAKFGEIVRLTSGGSGNTDELVSISYNDKCAAIKALQSHFTNKEFPYLDIAKGSSLLLVNSSESSDNEESSSNHHGQSSVQVAFNNDQQVQQVPTQHMAPIGSQLSSSTSNSNSGGGRKIDPFHDPLPVKLGANGSDVVDELLKPFQSYFSIYRTGQYHNPLGSSGDQVPLQGIPGMPDFNPANGVPVPPPPMASMPVASHPLPQHAPQQQQQQQRSPDKKYRIKSVPKMPNGAPTSPAHHIQPPQAQQQQQQPSPVKTVVQNDQAVDSAESEIQSQVRDIGPVELDVFGLYSLTFVNKAKDLSERKVRQDFGKYGDVSRVRGGFNTSGESIIVSFNDKEAAEKAVNSSGLASKYGPSLNTCPNVDVVSDKDGHFSVEFVNSGMYGIREITNEFSKHGEVMKVMAGGAKNAVKRVTVSFADRQAAFDAVKTHETSKDFVSIDFSRDCLAVQVENQS